MLAGGPPCQGFSKNVPRKLRFADDPNNLLVKRFLDYCEHMKPKSILMENVAEFRNGFSKRFSDEINERLNKAGYAVTSAVLNAAEYGIPQKRRRAFFLAFRGSSAPTVPTPTHFGKPKQQLGFETNNFVSVWDAIGDLPSLAARPGRRGLRIRMRAVLRLSASAPKSKRTGAKSYCARTAPVAIRKACRFAAGGRASKICPKISG